MKKPINALIISDGAEFVCAIETRLSRSGLVIQARRVEAKEVLHQELERQCPDVILVERALRSFDCSTAAAIAREKRPDTPFICVAATEESAGAQTTPSPQSAPELTTAPLSKLAATLRRALREAEKRSKLRDTQLRVLTSRWLPARL
jgi:DNA-binding NtrC family response regulator